MSACSDRNRTFGKPSKCIFIFVLSDCPLLGEGISQLFSRLPSPTGGGSGKLSGSSYRLRRPCEAGRPQQVAGAGWLSLRDILEDVVYVCVYSDGCVQPLVCPGRCMPCGISKGMITLIKKGGKHVLEKLDDNRPITLLNTDLKILVRVLSNRLMLVVSDLNGPDQSYLRSKTTCIWLAKS